MARKKITLTLDEKTLEQMEFIAQAFSLSRSAVVSLSVAKFAQQENLLDLLPEMVKLAKAHSEAQAKEIEE